ncbi:hypothetical protein GIB67_021225 [Kingdonia uniflora]|uniref:Uncharacterized protein n=1 Tax=Kingdonia uniflora TaxID=39325 RepID=A0A7J7LFU8_9MAGN|nr:hypothetical protein GIB67_021225 [Kingdonia uniflora]
MLSQFVEVGSVRRLGRAFEYARIAFTQSRFSIFRDSSRNPFAKASRVSVLDFLKLNNAPTLTTLSLLKEGEIGDVDGYRVECVRHKRLSHQEWARLHDYCPGFPAAAFITDILVTVAERPINAPSNPLELTASLITLLLFERSVEGYLRLYADPFLKVVRRKIEAQGILEFENVGFMVYVTVFAEFRSTKFWRHFDSQKFGAIRVVEMAPRVGGWARTDANDMMRGRLGNSKVVWTCVWHVVSAAFPKPLSSRMASGMSGGAEGGVRRIFCWVNPEVDRACLGNSTMNAFGTGGDSAQLPMPGGGFHALGFVWHGGTPLLE